MTREESTLRQKANNQGLMLTKTWDNSRPYVVMDTETGCLVFPVAYVRTGNGASLQEVSQYLAKVA